MDTLVDFDGRSRRRKAIAFNLEWVNDPSISSPDAVARQVRGFIDVFLNGTPLHQGLVARWDETGEPEPSKPTAHLAAIDLGIGERRTMGLIMKFENDACPFLFNNESYSYPFLQRPEFRLGLGDQWDVRVRIRGENVDSSASVLIRRGEPAPVVKLVDQGREWFRS
jgi:hypothetical protein